jgi:hypothetical protein
MWLHGSRQVARAEAVSIPGERRGGSVEWRARAAGIQAVRFVPFRVLLVWYIVLLCIQTYGIDKTRAAW